MARRASDRATGAQLSVGPADLIRISQILFDEFEEAQKGKLSAAAKKGRILKLVLFGQPDVSAAGGGTYELLVVVNGERFVDRHTYWRYAAERFDTESGLIGRLSAPVRFQVLSRMELADQIARGRPFFVDILRRGHMLYEAAGFPLPAPRPLCEEDRQAEARRHFAHWLPLGRHALKLARHSLLDGVKRDAAFLLHQAAERLYLCVLLVRTLFGPKLHRLDQLRSLAEALEPQLIAVWPREGRFARRCFARLDQAYVDARYATVYDISRDELYWLMARIDQLAQLVEIVLQRHLT